MRIFFAFLLLLLTTPAPAYADAMTLGWPLACTHNDDCWLVNYTDQDPTAGTKDYTCGALTYDGHKGTDIAVRDRAAMRKGMDVLAAMDGKVVRVRNDMDDHMGTEADISRAKQEKKECGNLVSLLHDSKWVTEYCHMKKGSVAVKLGQQVLKGDKLGQVGQSGFTEFPHLHFSLHQNNKMIDPFTDLPAGDCKLSGRQMWDNRVPYDPVKIYASGFTGGPADYNKILDDAASPYSLPADSAGLVFWALVYGAAAGDTVTLDVHGPDGSSFASVTETLPKNKAQYFRFTGRKNSGKPFPKGVYNAKVTLTRGDLQRTAQNSLMVK